MLLFILLPVEGGPEGIGGTPGGGAAAAATAPGGFIGPPNPGCIAVAGMPIGLGPDIGPAAGGPAG